jgi:Phasin protein
MEDVMAKAVKGPVPKATAGASTGAAPKATPAEVSAAPAQDFVVKELQTSADDAVKLAYGSMTLPPAQFLGLFSKVGEEYLKFVSKRLQAQAGRMEKLSACASVEDVTKVEMTFFGKAAQDYAEQLDRLAEVTHDAAKSTDKTDQRPS